MELSSLEGDPPVAPKLPSSSKDPTSLAAQIRSILDVTEGEQQSLKNKDQALIYWKAKVEGLGILVLETSGVHTSEMRGFSLVDGLPLVIVLNGEDSSRGKVFTLLHELARLCIGSAGVCDLHSSALGRNDVEVYCNAVAGSALMPEHLVRNNAAVQTHKADSPFVGIAHSLVRGLSGQDHHCPRYSSWVQPANPIFRAHRISTGSASPRASRRLKRRRWFSCDCEKTNQKHLRRLRPYRDS